MTTLLELVRQRRQELEAAQPESAISDEQRIWALMALQDRAEQGDQDARVRLAAIHKLFERSGTWQPP